MKWSRWTELQTTMAKPVKDQVFRRKIWLLASQGCSICCQNLYPDWGARKKELVSKTRGVGRKSFLLLDRFSSEQQIQFCGKSCRLCFRIRGFAASCFLSHRSLNNAFSCRGTKTPNAIPVLMRVLHAHLVYRGAHKCSYLLVIFPLSSASVF